MREGATPNGQDPAQTGLGSQAPGPAAPDALAYGERREWCEQEISRHVSLSNPFVPQPRADITHKLLAKERFF